ncbi:phosphate uptake regulator, PhoU [Thermanaerovibrio acidaminovorans DSM 6589]|uniref:Phosphate-specific transport system accessory protein PhoU n=1 Tax=Thermanaerovibrio acidaminovorans (strain ATCC 49978 / DSM 6589 / Su883) TaxID=525903 RepID=D1B7S8_THEAS|nr:phosphate signaling complex protein PhoU [Thermanaerovibrio acidaminovorans]ACZ18331.1 phosphate uptake regulator, PhoU [Thermanaerovibrio acidaminovorans DSM 6589]
MEPLNIRKHMDQDLGEIRSGMMRLGAMAEASIRGGVAALVKRDRSEARRVIESDDEADQLAGWLDMSCLEFMARYQPLGADLRAISCAIHMAVDLERIADLGVSVAKRALRLMDQEPIKPLMDIPLMGDRVCAMLDLAVKAYLNGDEDLARELCAMDDQVDDLQDRVERELLMIMIDRPATIAQASALGEVARVLERAGDHATNLGEHIMFMITGRRVKASQFRRPLGDRS